MTRTISAQQRFWNGMRGVGIVLMALFILIPLAYIVLISLTPDTQVGDGTLWPSHLAFENYAKMWQTVHLGQGIRNSVIIAGITGLLATLVALGSAYVLARFKFRGRKTFMLSLITIQTIPSVMLLLPLFVIIVVIQDAISVHLVGRYFTVILTYLTFALPFACWLLYSYMSAIPVDLEEAGFVDGCTRLQALRHVVFPLLLPGMVVTFVFSFLLAWGDVLFASVLTSAQTHTVAVSLQAYVSSGESGGDVYWGQLMAASLASGLPVMVIFLIFQKYIIGGLASGAVKG
ncbi:MAG: carbohydrate ABC transporter permease [Alicyclobacillus herbarius]|uniref:carbohydrate ABC transporter permease n=1 Tax=Alicyclobacillus herbarius TaxID=122960 RepID=UPI0003F6293D|nr:carbohydrate ABC transporter permease [Alicyclobacillus herbarius]MCL6632271.1 carbohydrate ABC transporter permease [Alicyclobacillus herbarius]